MAFQHDRILAFFYGSFVLLIVAGITHYFSRGLDLTDESMYLLDLIYPEQSNPTRKGNVIIAHLLSPLHLDIVGYRTIRLLGTLFTSVLFAWGLSSYWSRNGNDQSEKGRPWTLLAIIILGALASYALFPRTLSYNSLGGMVGMWVAALLLSLNRRVHPPKLIALGMLLAFQCFNKLPSGLALSTVAMLWLMFPFRRRPFQMRLLDASYAVLGGLASFLAYWVLFGSPISWIGSFLEIAALDSTHGIQDTLLLYGTILLNRLWDTLIGGWYMILLGALAIVTRKVTTLIHVGLAALILGAGLFWAWREGVYLQGALHYDGAAQLFVVLELLALFSLTLPVARSENGPHRLTLFVICGLPWLLSVGTNSDIVVHAQQYIVFPLAVLTYSVLSIDSTRVAWSRITLVSVLVGIMVSQTWSGHSLHPYRISAPLDALSSPIQTLNSRELIVDANTASLYTRLKVRLMELEVEHARTGMISLSKLPGLNYLAGLIPVGSSWYTPDNPLLNCYKLRTISGDLTSILVVVKRGQAIDDCILESLTQAGFKGDFFVPNGVLKLPEGSDTLHIYQFDR